MHFNSIECSHYPSQNAINWSGAAAEPLNRVCGDLTCIYWETCMSHVTCIISCDSIAIGMDVDSTVELY